ncbi:MAG: SCO family protein [Rickettsiales bacterium]|nr:SCO family protein [Rickettsiales bacterium]
MLRNLTLLMLFCLTAMTVYLQLSSTEETSKDDVPIGGEFSLTSHIGKQVTNDSFKGKPRLVYFGFTYCPDICPMGLSTMQAALEELRGDAPEGIFITVDPERDTQKQLALYIQNFPNILGLTGTPEQIKAAAKTYRIYYKKIENKESPKDYTMDHASLIYLMDGEGKYLAHFPHTASPQELVARIKQAL